MPEYPELAPRSNQRLGAPATGNISDKKDKQFQHRLVSSQGISSSSKESLSSLSSCISSVSLQGSRSSSEVPSSAVRRSQSSSSQKNTGSSSSRRCMRKWVTIGDYEGEAIVGDDHPGNKDENNVEQRQDRCDENGEVDKTVRLEQTKDTANEKTVCKRLGKSSNDTCKGKVETCVSAVGAVNTASSFKKAVNLRDSSSNTDVALKKSSIKVEVNHKNCSSVKEVAPQKSSTGVSLEKRSSVKEVVLERHSTGVPLEVSSTRKEVLFDKNSQKQEVSLEKYSIRKETLEKNLSEREIDLENYFPIIENSEDNIHKSNGKKCNGIAKRNNDGVITDGEEKKTKSQTENTNNDNEKEGNKKKCLGKWNIVEKLTIKSNGESTNGVDNQENSKTNTTAEENSDVEEMDAELPTPEHITSFYDLVKAVKNSNENLSPQEIENKFKQLSLAFKTDRLTLRQRLDVQQRQRDIAETNFERELNQLKTLILALHENCIDMELVDAIMTLRKHIDVITTSSTSLLSSSEVWGAVQQEWKVSRALEVLLLHVENVNRLYERDHQELEELRRLLAEHQIELPISPNSTSANQTSSSDTAVNSRRLRALSLAGISKQSSETGTRRISLGPGASKAVLNNFMGSRSSRRRASLMPDLRPFHQEFANVAAAAVAANASSSQDKEEKSHPNNGMLNSSITEEGSESGDDGASESQSESIDKPNALKPSAAHLRRLTQLYGQAIQESEQRSYEESNPSPSQTPGAESHQSFFNPVGSLPLQQHWVIQWLDELIASIRDGQWPYTPLQTLRGAFTSFLLVLSVFYFILATSSASEEPEPCYPDWKIFIKHMGPRPI